MTWYDRRGLAALVTCSMMGAVLLMAPQVAMAMEPDEAAVGAEMRAKIEHRIRTMRAMVLTEALDLDEPTSKKLFALMDDYDERRRKLTKERRVVMEEVKRAATDPSADHKKVDKLFKRLVDSRMAESRLNLEMAGATKGILSPQQRARLALVLPKFYRRVQKLINEAKREMMRKALDL